jgi:protein-disulfide isomerase
MLIKRTKKDSKVLAMFTGYSFQTKLMVVMNIGLIGAAFALGFMYGQLRLLKSGTLAAANTNPGVTADAAAPTDQPLSDSSWQSILVKPVAAKGPTDAKVTVVEFSDYQCPFCEQYYTQTEGQVQKDYIDSGKIRYIHRDRPLPFHPTAHIAAEAARCAGDQNKYWEFHDQLFLHQNDWVSLSDPSTQYATYAQSVGMNSSKFSQCLSSGKFKADVDADLNMATSIGANGTPTFYINGKPLVGAQPYSAFQSAIDAALNS